MSLYVRVFNNFYSHRKTARLRAQLGTDALWIPPRLWAYAAENQPDGVFVDYSPEEMATLIGFTGDAKVMLQALLQAGFLDSDPLRIHDWEDHNAYHKTFSERASAAGKARWQKQKESNKEKGDDKTETGNEKKGKEASIASSIGAPLSIGRPVTQVKGKAPRMFVGEMRREIEIRKEKIKKLNRDREISGTLRKLAGAK